MNKTASILKKTRAAKQGALASNLEVTVKGEKYRFDNLLIGKFGVLNVVCFDKKGELYGNEKDEFFALVTKKLERERVPNLIKTAEKNEMALREIFAKEKVYNIKIESIIVLEDNGTKPLFTSQKIPFLTLSALKKHLKQERFESDNNIDPHIVFGAIERYKN